MKNRQPVVVLAIVVSLLCVATVWEMHGAVPVRGYGTGILTFDAAPTNSDWSTYSVGVGSDTISSSNDLDAAVQLLSGSLITNSLGATFTVPPAQNALARWNATEHLVQTRPAGNAFTVLMATLVNETARDIPNLTISYSLGTPD